MKYLKREEKAFNNWMKVIKDAEIHRDTSALKSLIKEAEEIAKLISLAKKPLN